MTAVLAVLSALLLLCIPAAYYFGRRSAVDEAVDRRLAKETRLPRLNSQSASDEGEARDG